MRAKETRDGSIVDARDGSIKEKGGGISSLLIDGSVGEQELRSRRQRDAAA